MKKIVVIGGGTGLSSLLRGLKKYPVKLTAIVAVTDEGGSSGRLRKELKIIPPGDIRNCLVALSEEESLMTHLFQYRFGKGVKGPLKGHSFGNLFLAALGEIAGSFSKGIVEASKVLFIKGDVLPVTLSNVRLKARLSDGKTICGEMRISSLKKGEKIIDISLAGKDIRPNPLAIKSIEDSDCIILGPGSLYTSIITNLLVPGISEAIRRASSSRKIYVSNIMTQPGETDGYTLSDHIKEIRKHLICDFDVILVDRSPHNPTLLRRYAASGAFPVVNDISRRYKQKCDVNSPEIISGRFASSAHYARHDPDKLSKALINIISRG